MKQTGTIIFIFMLMFLGTKIHAEQENRKVSPFNGISLKISAELYLMQGNSQSVSINADASTLENLITEVKGHVLIIRSIKKDFFSSAKPNKNIKIYITCPEISSISVMGTGNVFNKNLLTSRIIDLSVMGSGNIVLSGLNTESVKGTIMGSGKISLASRNVTNKFKLIISGSGYYKGSEFPAKNVNIKISGSGDAVVNATNDLDVHISGSGEVMYTGNPNITTAIIGSGKIKELKKDVNYELNSMKPIKR
ncbi:MAG: DUF2807 domain-containing protein [Prolixibacteraceae bacterium]|nr:DUF2807 domain-containing protein [Prolixibacteraceae bacterium]